MEQAPRLSVEKETVAGITTFHFSGVLASDAPLGGLLDGNPGEVAIILRNVTSVTLNGAQRFRELLRDSPAPVHLALAGEAVLRGLVQASALPRARVCSARIRLQCASCLFVAEQVLDAEALGALRQGGPLGLACSGCGGTLAPVPGSDLSWLAQVALHAPSPELRALLDAPAKPRRASAPVKPRGTSFGNYQLLKSIGAGGMAEVFLAEQATPPELKKTVAIKRMRSQLASDEALVTMFEREARLAVLIEHPNVVRTFEFGKIGDYYYISMEYVPGWDLEAILRRCKSAGLVIPVELACRIVIDLCAGLHAAHNCVAEDGLPRGIIHRDLSPHNVLVSSAGVVKLADFGLAKATDSISVTLTGDPKGKLGYVAPEMVRPAGRRTDARVDIFAAGVLLHECLTREKLFRRASDILTLEALMGAPIPRVAQLRPDVSDRLDEILLRALERDREQRYPTAQAMQRDLEGHLASLGKPATADELASWLHTVLGMQPPSTVAAAPSRPMWSSRKPPA